MPLHPRASALLWRHQSRSGIVRCMEVPRLLDARVCLLQVLLVVLVEGVAESDRTVREILAPGVTTAVLLLAPAAVWVGGSIQLS